MHVESLTWNGSFDLATLALGTLRDGFDQGLLQSILHIMARNPKVCESLPPFQYQHDVCKGMVRGTPSGKDTVRWLAATPRSIRRH